MDDVLPKISPPRVTSAGRLHSLGMTLRPPTLASTLLLCACAPFDPGEDPITGSDTTSATTSSADATDVTATMPSTMTTDTTPSTASTTDDDTSADTSPADTSAADTSAADTTTEPATSTDGSDTTDATGDSTDTGNPACVVDGMIGEGEECDDANEAAGDGCSDCLYEDGWGCANEPTICFPACHPLVDDCGAGFGCYLAEPTWACIPDGSGGAGAQFDPCANLNGCDPGLQCVNAEVVTGCSDEQPGCCSTICDPGDPQCPGGLTCVLFYGPGEAPPGLDDVGICT